MIKVYGEGPPSSSKLCVILVYQPKSFPESLLRTIDFFSAKGYSVLVVANSGLSEKGREVVLPKVWRLLERPNFGYDFGGYRDAIHYLANVGVAQTHLILMNDSIWFPMWSKTTAIERLEASSLDVTGLFLHVPARNEFEKASLRPFKRRQLSEHIESYLTLVPEETLQRPEFKDFWRNYRQTSSKTMTIKRGEIGFSKSMTEAGLKVGALSRRRTFLEGVETFSDDMLEKTLRYAAYSDKHFDEDRIAILAGERSKDWRKSAMEHIQRVVERRRFNASFCWATEEIFDVSFQKKHPGKIFQESRKRFLEAVDNGDLSCDNEAALDELRRRVQDDQSSMVTEIAHGRR